MYMVANRKSIKGVSNYPSLTNTMFHRINRYLFLKYVYEFTQDNCHRYKTLKKIIKRCKNVSIFLVPIKDGKSNL